jgi:hypothetical protein
MPFSFQEILTAFEFVGSAGLGEHQAILCRQTGKIYLHSESADFDELDELPDDVESKAAEHALREWCAVNSVEVAD